MRLLAEQARANSKEAIEGDWPIKRILDDIHVQIARMSSGFGQVYIIHPVPVEYTKKVREHFEGLGYRVEVVDQPFITPVQADNLGIQFGRTYTQRYLYIEW